MKFETVIGLEIHVQLKTATKMFCGCLNSTDDYEPNRSICAVCMGHPGVLPRTNYQAVDFALRLAQSLDFTISRDSKFDRKHYFYPDLPKGYQISQFDEPLASNGSLIYFFNARRKKIRFERLHLEEDAAKLVHISGSFSSLVDFNRAGTPLVELVTKPDFTSPEEARAFLQELQLIVRTLGISDADMEKGQLRCDANISLRPDKETFIALQRFPDFENEQRLLWPKTEIKNMNSFRSIERALTFEVKRQTLLWEEGKPPRVETTRGWDDEKDETLPQRSKESSEDYRYLIEPDLPRILVSLERLSEIESEAPELPQRRRDRFDAQYHLDAVIRDVLVTDRDAADFFEEVISEVQAWLIAKKPKHNISKQDKEQLVIFSSSWIITKLFEVLREKNVTFATMKLSAENFAETMLLLHEKIINSSTATKMLRTMVVSGEDPSNLVESQGLQQLTNQDELVVLVQQVLDENVLQVEEYKLGKISLLQFFIGKVMQKTSGRAAPELTKKILETLLR